jgi:hypothetical protein
MALSRNTAFSGHDGHRVTWDHVHEGKSQQSYADKRWDN